MSNRPKISSLTEMELAQLLGELFFLIGKDVNLQGNETKLFLNNVYVYHGQKYVDSFRDAFIKYAACELPDAESLQPQISFRFVSKLMKAYFNKNNEAIFHKSEESSNLGILTPEEKYILFVQFVKVNKRLPGNCDWVTLYEHLKGLKKLTTPPEWDSLTFYKKWKYAMNAVTEWTYTHFSITGQPIYINTKGNGPLKGIGSRIGEALWNYNR